MSGSFAAAHESENGPLRHFAAPQQLGRFRSKADIESARPKQRTGF
jgi:hypothetical protein